MANKYDISIQTVKNAVSEMSRIMRLKEEMFIYETVSFRSLKEVYQSVYADYTALKAQEPQLSFMAYTQRLADQYEFTPQNITRIVQIMSNDTAEDYLNKKRKLTTTETYNRDKAIFVEYLRWTGNRKKFTEYAAKKYNLSYKTISLILTFCLYADPKRRDMV